MSGFGRWSISEFCFNYIRDLLPSGKIILELGSGWGTGKLAKYYKMYSIESSRNFVNKYDSTYIHAPIKFYDEDFIVPDIPENKGWYNPDIVKKNLPEHYDLILVDGPWSGYGRGGFYKYLDLFNTDVSIIFDDIHRNSEKILIEKVSKKINRNYTLVYDSDTKLLDITIGVISNAHS